MWLSVQANARAHFGTRARKSCCFLMNCGVRNSRTASSATTVSISKPSLAQCSACCCASRIAFTMDSWLLKAVRRRLIANRYCTSNRIESAHLVCSFARPGVGFESSDRATLVNEQGNERIRRVLAKQRCKNHTRIDTRCRHTSRAQTAHRQAFVCTSHALCMALTPLSTDCYCRASLEIRRSTYFHRVYSVVRYEMIHSFIQRYSHRI